MHTETRVYLAAAKLVPSIDGNLAPATSAGDCRRPRPPLPGLSQVALIRSGVLRVCRANLTRGSHQ